MKSANSLSRRNFLGADFVRDSQKRIDWFRWGAQIRPRLPDSFGK